MAIEINKKVVFLGLGILFGGGVIWVFSRKSKRSKFKKIDFSIFDSPDLPNSGQCMDHELIKKLQLLEKKTGYPVFQIINSGARSEYWNTKVGGVKNSAHKIPACKAVDIKTSSIDIRNRIVFAAKELGFTRIGIGKKLCSFRC